MSRALALCALLLVACAASHTTDDAGHASDAAATHDGATADGASLDGGATHVDSGGGGGEHVVCGPNVCRSGEICCNERCGVCAFPTECVDYGCVGGP